MSLLKQLGSADHDELAGYFCSTRVPRTLRQSVSFGVPCVGVVPVRLLTFQAPLSQIRPNSRSTTPRNGGARQSWTRSQEKDEDVTLNNDEEDPGCQRGRDASIGLTSINKVGTRNLTRVSVLNDRILDITKADSIA